MKTKWILLNIQKREIKEKAEELSFFSLFQSKNGEMIMSVQI
jgi:hypothetical protein